MEQNQALINTLKASEKIKKVYFDKDGNHYLSAFPEIKDKKETGKFFAPGGVIEITETVSREEILGEEPVKKSGKSKKDDK